ncbi:hypothetical protein HMPREF9431_01548 [Segatella oulorum F0390]|uniref:Uncharacterized protein n=1 Tax=Segatella oulorum F0390 TaxID=702438 RepID=G1WCJ7_9BACT|nr:hypothetical protein HMPREF9431_01548 [Segatella oulorum F0390]
MITKDKVTEIFCIIDEFDKNLDGELKRNLRLPAHNGNGKRYRNRKGRLSESEVMTILRFLYAIISVPIAILRSIIKIVSAAASTKSSPMRYPIIAL